MLVLSAFAPAARRAIYLVLVVVGIGLASGASADAVASPAAVAQPARALGPSKVQFRHPSNKTLREFRTQREFRYVEVRSELSAWDIFWMRFWRWLGELLSTDAGRLVWKYGIYTLLVVALIFVVLKLLDVDVTRAFGRAARVAPLAYDADVENIHALNFAEQIAAAEAAGNYRLAVRLGYLHILKDLTDRGLIRWQPEKTNHDYLFELPDGPLPAAFQDLTRQFEYVWYGEHEDLSAAQYAATQTTRLAFQRQLSTIRQAA
ncbi:DUF4129 domain-containing protein [Hymenobacter lutimineralis]|uniref:DUF4129 domain-containing protein n=1 Tax=Hymenobacter lutimineralis TaxID=2606448 RepID=A0A5D6V0T8_9BACT|nr:DUF4129 domain-containing protein [Hymenobacter lutimineralis]TYZ08698.1 DUF4129 domain-containing protein [Hymenobacter lutimineralis]